MKAFQLFSFKVLLTATLSAVIIYLIQSATNLLQGFEMFTWYSLVFMSVLTLFSFALLQRGLSIKGHAFFMQYFGAMFAIKVFAALLFVCWFIYVEPIGNKQFVFPFFMLYLLFTGLLVVEAMRILKRK